MNNEQSLFTFTKDPLGCVPNISEGRPVVVPLLPLSPIAPDSADNSVTATMGSSRDESIFPSEVGVMVPPLGDVRSGSDSGCTTGGLTTAFRRRPDTGFVVGTGCPSVSGRR